jgi:hypothetical protein
MVCCSFSTGVGRSTEHNFVLVFVHAASPRVWAVVGRGRQRRRDFSTGVGRAATGGEQCLGLAARKLSRWAVAHVATNMLGSCRCTLGGVRMWGWRLGSCHVGRLRTWRRTCWGRAAVHFVANRLGAGMAQVGPLRTPGSPRLAHHSHVQIG